MNYGVIINLLGKLLGIETILFLIPLFIALFNRESDVQAFLYAMGITGVFALLLTRVKYKTARIRAKEGLSIVALGWVAVSLFGALPFVLSGYIPCFIDAFFETISGLTTTGATILTDIEILPMGLLFWRSFTHWLGGMGILVLTLAILPALGVGGFQIFKAETTGPISDKLVPRIQDTAKILYTAYLGLTLLQILVLLLGGMSLYEALLHTFGTVGTGGFSNKNASIGAYDSNFLVFSISSFMLAAGVNFSLYYDLYKGRWRNLLGNAELKLYLAIIFVSTAFVVLNLYGTVYPSLLESMKHAFFQVTSFITTTGFSTVDFDHWPTFSKVILFLLMFVGGCAGSTGGSIKVIRLLIALKVIQRELARILHPKAHLSIHIGERTISNEVLISVASFYFLFLLIFVAGTLLLSLEGISLVSAASAAAATLGNIGPGFEFVGPTQNFSGFSSYSKLLLSFFMLLGRLELFTVFILLTPGFWKE